MYVCMYVCIYIYIYIYILGLGFGAPGCPGSPAPRKVTGRNVSRAALGWAGLGWAALGLAGLGWAGLCCAMEHPDLKVSGDPMVEDPPHHEPRPPPQICAKMCAKRMRNWIQM